MTAVQCYEHYLAEHRMLDPVQLMFELRIECKLPLHGPEYHPLVPAAFLGAYFSRYGEPEPEQTHSALEEAGTLKGGTCAYWGTCSAAIGLGITYATILHATPFRGAKRGAAQTVVSEALRRMAELSAPRCCRRETLIALQVGCEYSESLLPHPLDTHWPTACDQVELNRECIRKRCLFFVEGSIPGG